MPSSFFGLSIASSGLNAYQAAINTTANNISNVQTEGYSKQQVTLEESSSLRAYQKFGTTGTGVTATSVEQLRDQYYDEKYWNNQSRLGEFDKKLYYMEQIENYYTDDMSKQGFSTIYAKMFNAMNALYSDAGNTSVRNEFISDAVELMQYFNGTATQLQELQSTINEEIKSTVDNVNSIAEKIASLNKQINTIEMSGSNANELRDARALLIDELSEIVPVQVEEHEVTNSNYPNMYTGATYFTVKVNGVLLVDTYNYQTLETKTRLEKDNQSDIDGLYDVIWTNSGAELNVSSKSMTGGLRALFQVRDGNNRENLTGRVTSTTANTITLSKPSITDINQMNMPEEGTISINNTEYKYDGFSFETDEEGNITSYTFNLKNAMDSETQVKARSNTAIIGSTIDYKGIPYYLNQMSTFLRSFATLFNDLERTGVDYNGDKMNSFIVATNPQGVEYDFASSEMFKKGTEYTDIDGSTANVDGKFSCEDATYYRMTACNVKIAQASIEDPKIFSVTTDKTTGVDDAALVKELMKLQSDTIVYKGCGGDDFLQCIYADMTVDTQECKVFVENYTSISSTIDGQRTSISGVDEDEEAMDLIKFQNAYNLASKCISVLAEMYDQLILNTGV